MADMRVKATNFPELLETLQMRNGVVRELNDAYRECSACSKILGKESKITLTVSMKPKDGMMEFTCDVKSKPAKPAPIPVSLHGTPDGHHQYDDPKQTRLDVDNVHQFDKSTGEVYDK